MRKHRARKCKAERIPISTELAIFFAKKLGREQIKILEGRLVFRKTWAELAGEDRPASWAKAQYRDAAEALQKWIQWHEPALVPARRKHTPRKGELL